MSYDIDRECALCCGRGINGNSICPRCDGDGVKRNNCATCKGSRYVIGMRTRLLGLLRPVRDAVPCLTCGGTGIGERVLVATPRAAK